MKKIILTLAFGIAFLSAAQAQQRVEVTYESPDSIPSVTNGLMEFLDVKYLKAHVHGGIRGKKWTLYLHEANGGTVTSSPVLPYAFEFSDTTASFSFFARQDGNDSAYVRAVTPRYSSAKRKYAIAADNGTAYPSEYILMETFPEKPYDTSCEIILAAFTTGLVEKVNYGGQQGVRIDYCGLRDTHVDPKTWQEKYKVPRFIYFSLKLED